MEGRFILHLREFLDAPAVSKWRKATTAGDVLDRRLAVVRALTKLQDSGWEKSSGGFMVPKGQYDFLL